MSIFATIRCHEIKIPYWPAVAAFLLGRGDPDCLIGPRRGRYSPTDRHYHSYQGRRRLADSSRCPRIHLRSGGRNTPDSGARVLSLRRSRAHRRLPFPLLGAATKPGNRQFPLPGCGRIRSGKRRSGPRQGRRTRAQLARAAARERLSPPATDGAGARTHRDADENCLACEDEGRVRGTSTNDTGCIDTGCRHDAGSGADTRAGDHTRDSCFRPQGGINIIRKTTRAYHRCPGQGRLATGQVSL